MQVSRQLDAPCLCRPLHLHPGPGPDAPLGPQQPPAAPQPPACLGAVLLGALLVAAAGGMRPDLLLPIGTAAHGALAAAGPARFRGWLRCAIDELSLPGCGLPWVRLKAEARAEAEAELCGPACAGDAMRFKRALKALCGGKKKQQPG